MGKCPPQKESAPWLKARNGRFPARASAINHRRAAPDTGQAKDACCVEARWYREVMASPLQRGGAFFFPK